MQQNNNLGIFGQKTNYLDPNNHTQKSFFSQNTLDIAKYQPQKTSGWDSFKNNFKNNFKQGFQNQMAYEAENKGFGASNWAQTGVNALGTIANIGLGIAQYNLAKKNLDETIKQREIENKRYEEQKARHIKATDDAASTAGGLKSANMMASKDQDQTLPRMAQE